MSHLVSFTLDEVTSAWLGAFIKLGQAEPPAQALILNGDEGLREGTLMLWCEAWELACVWTGRVVRNGVLQASSAMQCGWSVFAGFAGTGAENFA